MSKKAIIDEFVNVNRIAVVGASSSPKKFGNLCYQHLKTRLYDVVPVNPHASQIDGKTCYPDLLSIPEPVDAALVVVPKSESLEVVKQAHAAGISLVWLQQGSGSPEAHQYCEANNIKYITGECIFMFSEPVQSIHKFHRFINKIIGRLPA